jgi:hypothetical protein
LRPTVDQRQAKAGQDVVAGDKITQNIVSVQRRTVVDRYSERLAKEIAEDSRVYEVISELQYFTERIAPDAIEGLEAKLEHADRSSQLAEALRQKELFARLLARFSLYQSAQVIIAYLLSQAESVFRTYILPHVSETTPAEYDKLIYENVIVAIVDEVGDTDLAFNHHLAAGLVYWLADQCYVRWHA